MSVDSENGSVDITYEKVIELLHKSEWPMATTEVAEAFGITQQSAHYRLTRLHERGEIERKKAGGNAVLWRVKED